MPPNTAPPHRQQRLAVAITAPRLQQVPRHSSCIDTYAPRAATARCTTAPAARMHQQHGSRLQLALRVACLHAPMHVASIPSVPVTLVGHRAARGPINAPWHGGVRRLT